MGSTLRIGSTPHVSLCWSMKSTITSVGGRAQLVRKAEAAENLVRPLELSILSATILHVADQQDVDWTGVAPDQSPIAPLDVESFVSRLEALSQRAAGIRALQAAFKESQARCCSRLRRTSCWRHKRCRGLTGTRRID